MLLTVKTNMNKLLWSKDLNDGIESIQVGEESITILLEDDKKLTFSTYHQQDCCENVYGDFSIAKYHESELVGKTLSRVEVKSVKGMGFLLCFNVSLASSKIFIPCYNYQNGYYSSDLELVINDNGVKIEVDITDCTEGGE